MGKKAKMILGIRGNLINRQAQPFLTPIGKAKKGRAGFTLVEIVVSVAILSFGVVVLFEAFFICLDVFTYSLRSMNVQRWVHEKIWETEDELTRLGMLERGERKGSFTEEGKKFDWTMSVNLKGETQEAYLYTLDLMIYWVQGNRKVRLSQTAYVHN